jgi:protein TonB
MTTLRATAPASSGDRMSLALFIAVILHALLILGVGFTKGDREFTDDTPSLDITLVNTRSENAPENADYLAQANQDGAGNVTERVRPQDAQQSIDLGATGVTRLAVEPTPPEVPDNARELTVEDETGAAPPVVDSQPTPPMPVLTAEEMISRGMEIARLSAELNQLQKVYSERVRHKHITASTSEYKYASYMHDWITKVERIGNLNFPDEAVRGRLSGKLMLDVALRPDGSIVEMNLLRSSGFKVLDDAAQRIVRMAAPFAPFPEDIRGETDILHIKRIWVFSTSNQLITQ